MGGSSEKSWSDNPYAPQLPPTLYFAEKGALAGVFIGIIFHGIVVALFFQCMVALLNPVDNTKGNIKWPFVAHTVVMFSFVAVIATVSVINLSVSYVDNRGFPGSDALPPGPLGYNFFKYSKAVNFIPKIMFLLNSCLADGLLLYRCYVIYAMNYWVIAFPCLLYLVAFAMGIAYTCKASQANSFAHSLGANVGIPYLSILVSLNILLTLMIAVRLILHSKNTRNAMGVEASRPYKAIVTMLIESCALYAVTSLLFIIPWTVKSWVADVFALPSAEIQVVAPFLIILRAAKRSASTDNAVNPTSADSIRFGSRMGSISADETLREGESMS